MKIANWKTTLGAILVILSQLLQPMGIDISPELQGIIVAAGIGIIGLFAKDNNVTGGTKENSKKEIIDI